jgi:very-short-patch-repair endonuclease
VEELLTELQEGPRRGSANLRTALEDIGAGAWSAPEARAARILRRAAVPAFEQNARIDLLDGEYVIVDFLWRALRAVLEIDSRTHHFDDPADLDRTTDRHLKLETLGYTVAHRRPRLVTHEPQRFQRDVEAWLAGRRDELAGRVR